MNIKTFFKPTWAKIILTFLIPFSFTTNVNLNSFTLYRYLQPIPIPLTYTIIEYIPEKITYDAMHNMPRRIPIAKCGSFCFLDISDVITYSIIVLIINYLIACLLIFTYKKIKSRREQKIN